MSSSSITTRQAIAPGNGASNAAEELARVIAEALRGLEFGEIQVKVHDGQVVQVTRIEKLRVAPAPTPERSPRRKP